MPPCNPLNWGLSQAWVDTGFSMSCTTRGTTSPGAKAQLLPLSSALVVAKVRLPALLSLCREVPTAVSCLKWTCDQPSPPGSSSAVCHNPLNCPKPPPLLEVGLREQEAKDRLVYFSWLRGHYMQMQDETADSLGLFEAHGTCRQPRLSVTRVCLAM